MKKLVKKIEKILIEKIAAPQTVQRELDLAREKERSIRRCGRILEELQELQVGVRETWCERENTWFIVFDDDDRVRYDDEMGLEALLEKARKN